MILSTVTPVRKVALQGLPFCLCSRIGIRQVGFNTAKNRPRRPGLDRMPEWRFALDRPKDFPTGLVETTKFSQKNGEVIPLRPFATDITDCNILVGRLPVKSNCV